MEQKNPNNKKKIILITCLAILIMAGCFAGIAISNLNKLRLSKASDGHLLCVKMPNHSINSFDELPISYICFPSYIKSNYIVVDKSLDGLLVNGQKLGKIWHFQYDAVYEITMEHNGEMIQKQLMFKKSNAISSIFIDTQSGNMDYVWEEKENKEPAVISILDPKGKNVYEGGLEYIKGRGNTTWSTFRKKPYSIKFTEKLALFGMREQKKYVLLANTFDRSGISNIVAFDLGHMMGLAQTPKAIGVDLYLNGNYAGNYTLCDPVSMKLIDENSSKSSDATKQYIIEKDIYYTYEPYSFVTAGENAFSMKEPEEMTESELKEIKSEIQEIENQIIQKDAEVFEQLDLDSLARRYLIDRILGNVDIAVSSMYFYKKAGDNKLYSGPIWDYDRCYGLMGWDVYAPNQEMEEIRTEVLTWYQYLEEMPEFRERCATIYQNELRPNVKEIIDHKLDEYATLYQASIAMNHAVSYEQRSYFSGLWANVKYMKCYLTGRLNVYDQKYGLALEPLSFSGDGSMHIVLVLYEDDTYVFDVEDGKCFEIPVEFDDEEYDYWCIADNELLYKSNVPIFEDKVVVAHKRYTGED